MKVEHYVVGWVETNCYLAINEATSECIVIDPGDDAAMLASKIDEKGYTPAAILPTDTLTMLPVPMSWRKDITSRSTYMRMILI